MLVEHPDPGGAGHVSIARSPAQLAFEKLGGEKLIGVDVRSEADFIEVLDRGIPLDALSELTKGACRPRKSRGSSSRAKHCPIARRATSR